MSKIVCFSDSAALSADVQQALRDCGHDLHLLPASQLTAAIREQVGLLAPGLILLELTCAHENAHLLFFLRSERSTRNVPIILLAAGGGIGQHAAILGADDYLQRPFEPARLRDLLLQYLPRQEAMAAA